MGTSDQISNAALTGYLADENLVRRQPSVLYVGLAIGFHGWEMAAYEAVDSE